jgi:hypothetical protein
MDDALVIDDRLRLYAAVGRLDKVHFGDGDGVNNDE